MNIFETSVLMYLAIGAMMSAIAVAVGVRRVAVVSRKISQTALRDLLANDYYEAVSVLSPAYNVADSVVGSVRSMLNLQHPQFEVIVVNDGSTDSTLDELVAAFDLMEVPIAHDERIRTRLLVRMFRSVNQANLTVIDKIHGGRADALNAGLNLARRPLVATVDAGTICDPQALVRACRVFMEDPSVIAAVGAHRSATTTEMHDGRIDADAPRTLAGRIQANADVRNSIALAAADRFGSVLSISGCTTMRRQALRDVGGFDSTTLASDVDVAIRLHSRFGRDKRIVYIPEPMCWTKPVTTLRELAAARSKATRGLVSTLIAHRRMVGNPKDGRIGMLSLPAVIAFDVLLPVVEVVTYAYLAASAIFGHVDLAFAGLFLVLTAAYPALLSHVAVGAETLSGGCYAKPTDRFMIALAAICERVGIHQVLSVLRAYAALTPGKRIKRASTALPRRAPAVPVS